MDKYIIRTSDRKAFKKCRQAWDFGSKMRQDWEPNKVSHYLRFGTAIHKGLEVWHNPVTWEWTKDSRRDVLANLAVVAFYKAFPKPNDESGKMTTDPVAIAEWKEETILGVGMLQNFFAQREENFTPKFVEIEFEVPIVVPDDMVALVGRYYSEGFGVKIMTIGECEFEVLHYNEIPIYYQGRLDMLVEDSHGHYYIHDWKTTARFDELDWLDLEEQITSYCWALQVLMGIRISGFVYSELFKGMPSEPTVLKSGKLSKDKSQNVSKETYRAAIDRLGLPVADYQDFLDYLGSNERQYFRRTRVQRSQRELELAGRRIVLEAMDMVREDISIYPNPTPMNCKRCDFFGPCVLLNEGGDVEFALNNSYHKRSENAT